MDAQLLQRFVTVVEAGSLNKAAKQLRVSQPSLTRSIQLLEEYYAVELLRRFRAAPSEAERERYKLPLLLSINTIAAGLGATG